MLDVEASRLRRRVRSEAARSMRGVPRVLDGMLSLRPGLAHIRDLLGQTRTTKMMAGGQVEIGGRLECGVPVNQTLRGPLITERAMPNFIPCSMRYRPMSRTPTWKWLRSATERSPRSCVTRRRTLWCFERSLRCPPCLNPLGRGAVHTHGVGDWGRW